ncbi:K+-transporting ATPase A subunit [Mucilaginibacter lappiensis]|uniref:K+-transporting ATPase A subunit n=2 Tax=Mucilaginibacter lappiensis TaxID=354630 RepID=A0ABR6PKW2_9SPHI|nr:K+-transporting ATPase A subunit [Mucilaginibacter lappiensis]
MQAALVVNVIQLFVPVALTVIICFVYVNHSGGPDSQVWFSNKGPHGFTTMLYEYVFSVAGNCSNFGSLGLNHPIRCLNHLGDCKLNCQLFNGIKKSRSLSYSHFFFSSFNE